MRFISLRNISRTFSFIFVVFDNIYSNYEQNILKICEIDYCCFCVMSNTDVINTIKLRRQNKIISKRMLDHFK